MGVKQEQEKGARELGVWQVIMRTTNTGLSFATRLVDRTRLREIVLKQSGRHGALPNLLMLQQALLA
jgi:hypothetical protein